MLRLSRLLEHRDGGGDEGKGCLVSQNTSQNSRVSGESVPSHTGSAYTVFPLHRAGVEHIVPLEDALAVAFPPALAPVGWQTTSWNK